MFAREYLSVVSRWAKDQLRQGVQTPANRRNLRQLIEVAEALREQMPVEPETPQHVVRLADYRRTISSDLAKRRARFKSFLDG